MTDEEFSKLMTAWQNDRPLPRTREGRTRTHIAKELGEPIDFSYKYPWELDLQNPLIGVGSYSNTILGPRERTRNFLLDIYGDSPEARARVDDIMQRVEFFAATPFGAYDATRATSEGRYKDAVVPAITTAAPFVAKPLKAAVGSIGKRIRGPGFDSPVTHSDGTNILTSERKIVPETNTPLTNGNYVDEKASEALKVLDRKTLPNNDSRLVYSKTDMNADDYEEIYTPLGKPLDPIQVDSITGVRGNRASYSEALPADQNGGLSGQAAEVSARTPENFFLTKDLGEKRHNYPPDHVIAEDANVTVPDSTPLMWHESRKPTTTELFNPKPTSQRPFNADYSKTPAHDKNGRLREDIDGDPIIAEEIAGRQTLGGDDIGFNDAKFWRVAKKLAKIEVVPLKSMINPKTGSAPRGRSYANADGTQVIQVAEELPERHKARIVAHELGHTAHRIAGYPALDPMTRAELEPTYSRFRNGIENPEKLTLPRDFNDAYDDPITSDRELVAEGFYKAFAFPNEAKKEIPIFYKTLRQWIKSNPELAKRFINNSIVAATAAGVLGAAGERDEAGAAPPLNAQGKYPGDLGSFPGTALPFGLGSETAKAREYGLMEIAKAVSRLGLYPQAPRNEKYSQLVRVLASLKTRQEPQTYGGPR